MSGELPDAHWGLASSKQTNWRDIPDDGAEDDVELIRTPGDVVAMLGFDPKKEGATSGANSGV